MIKVEFSRNADGVIEGFQIKGHAGYAEEGQDIICSAVSAIAFTVLGYIDENLEIKNNSFFEEKDGYLKWDRSNLKKYNIDNNFDKKLDAVLDAMVIGLKQIRETYGEEYLCIQFKEVHS